MLRSQAVKLVGLEQEIISKNLRLFRPKYAYTSENVLNLLDTLNQET
jgi:hypothetical protein